MQLSSRPTLPSNRSIKRSIWRSWFIFLLYLGLTVLMTMPLITQLGTHIPAAEGSDVWVHEWTFWWIERALLNFQNPFYTDLLFHPTGVSLTTHNIAWFNIGIWFPLQAAVGNTVAYSLTYIVVFTLNAFCMYLLTYGWTRSRSAAVIAGLIYGFWPYTFTQSGHPNMATIMWPPLALFYLKRISTHGVKRISAHRHRSGISWCGIPWRTMPWRDMLMAGLFIALTGIARWQLLIVVSLLFGIYLLYLVSLTHSERAEVTPAKKGAWLPTWFSDVLQLAIPFLFAVVLMLPLGGPVIYTQLTQDFPAETLVYEPWFGSPLLTYLLPNSRLGFYKAVVDTLPENLQFHYQRVDFLGYTVLILALIGLIGRWRQTGIWLLILLLYWSLALGPELTLAYERLPDIPMPYRLVEDFSLIRIVRRPHRFNTFAALPLGLMAGYGVTVLLKSHWINRRSKHAALVLILLLSLLILGEYRPSPYGLKSTYIPDWYVQLADEPESFAIFGLPPSLRLADKYFMHYQILHEKPMIEGHISRPTHTTFGFMDQSDYLWHLRVHHEMKPELEDVSHQLQLLVDANVRYLVLHKYLLTEEQLAQFIDWLTYEPQYEDDEVLVYHADPQVDRDFEVEDWLTDEIGLISALFGPDEVRQGDIVRLDARWGSRSAPNQDYSACITLRDPNETPVDQSCHIIGGSWPTSEWQANEVARGDYAIRIAPLLAPGNYTISLDLVKSDQVADGGHDISAAVIAQRVMGLVNVAAGERTFEQPVSVNQVALRWGDQIQLHGFGIERGAEQIQVSLVWQALQRMDRSYKVFVHIQNVTTGEMIAQNDSIPRQWAYPTTWWEAHEYVDETIELTLAKPTDGAVRVFVGLYDEETGVRLPVLDADGTRSPDDAAILGEATP